MNIKKMILSTSIFFISFPIFAVYFNENSKQSPIVRSKKTINPYAIIKMDKPKLYNLYRTLDRVFGGMSDEEAMKKYRLNETESNSNN